MFISVVMAVYNGEKFIRQAIQSVLNQTYKEFELIIVNDGSTDGTPQILDTVQDERVKVIHVPANQGAAACLNQGIEQAQGDWIAIHDADDISEPNRLEEQAAYLTAHPDCTGVSSLIIGRIGKKTIVKPEIQYYNVLLNKRQIYDYRFFMCYLCHGSVVFSRRAFYRVGRYNPRYRISYDYDLWVRLFDFAPIQKIPKVLYQYRLRQDSLGKSNTEATISELMTISSLGIYKRVSDSGSKSVSLIIVGTRRGCLFFKRHVSGNFSSVKYVVVRGKADMGKLNILGLAEANRAILVLNNRFSDAVIRHLMRRGFRWNRHVFKIWNYKF